MTQRHHPAIAERIESSLAPLSELSALAVTDGEPDIRGWPLSTRAGIGVGAIADLVVDAPCLKVRYLLVTLDPPVAAGRGRDVLVPVGVAHLDSRRDEVLVRSGAASLLAAPRFAGCPMARADERALLRTHGWRDVVSDAVLAMGDFYRGPFFDERSCFAGRRGRADRAYLRRIADDAPGEVRVLHGGRESRRAPRPERGIVERLRGDRVSSDPTRLARAEARA